MDIYPIAENNCSKEGTDCSNMGLMPLNLSFMTKLGLKVVIIAKMIYSVKVKTCQFIWNAQAHAHIDLNQYTV